MIHVFVAPPTAPQQFVAKPAPTPPPKLNPLDEQIVGVLRQSGRYGLRIWDLLDKVAESRNPASRNECRSFRLEAWHRLKRLLRIGAAHRFGRKCVSIAKLPRPSVRRRPSSRPGSTLEPVSSAPQEIPAKKFSANLSAQLVPRTLAEHTVQKTESANLRPPDSEPEPMQPLEDRRTVLRSAAQTLASLPRGVKPKRKLSGFVQGVRVYRDQPILLADGSRAFALGARRGQLIFFCDIPHLMEPGRWGVVPAATVTLLKNEAAVALGRAKRGRKERTSALKVQTARMNGRCPCRRGTRGRPRTAHGRILSV